MNPEVLKRVQKVERLAKGHLITKDNQVIHVRDILYFTIVDEIPKAVLKDKKSVTLTQGLAELERWLEGSFFRIKRHLLINISKINGISRHYSVMPEPERKYLLDMPVEYYDECELHLEGCDQTFHVTDTYSKELKKLLGIKVLSHLVPDNTHDRKLRRLDLVDFGWRELERMDPADQEAVKTFQEKWDIKQFNRPKMLKYFRRIDSLELDKRKLIMNIIYQLWRWIKKGIEPLSDGNIRSMWYRIKAVLAYHSDILEPTDVDIFYSALTDMIEENRLFKYKDFGFMDVNAPYRGIGTTQPEIILASEKIGHYYFIKTLAEQVGASFICLKGEPAHISLEYFADDLHDQVGSVQKRVFVESDLDPAGSSIESNFIRGLKRNGHKLKQTMSLVDLSILNDDEIHYSRYPVVRYEKKGSEIIPIPPANAGQITKAMNWFDEEIQDERLRSVEEINNKTIVTIWGLELEAVERERIKQRFLDAIG